MSSASDQLAKLPTYSKASTTRLKALYSDISRQKHSNPTSFQANVDWWKGTLTDFVGAGLQTSSSDVLSLNVSKSLQENLRYEGAGRPLGLATVVSELRDAHALIPYDLFLSSQTSIYQSTSLLSRVTSAVVTKPLWWALQQLSLVDGDADSHASEAALWHKVSGKHVVLSLVENAADAVIERRQDKVFVSRADALYTLDTFREAFADVLPNVSLSLDDLKVLVRFLDRDKHVLVSDGDVIKFTESDSDRVISDVDRGILEVKTGITSTEAGNSELQRRIDEHDAKAREYIRQGRKEAAIAALRPKKRLEESLRDRIAKLSVLQEMLMNIEQAADNIEMMTRYEASTSTLKSILAHPSLQREKIDETLEAFADAAADHREINDAIVQAGLDTELGQTVDDADLEAELAGLVADAEREEHEKRAKEEDRRAQEIESSLPNVPSKVPGRPELVPLPPSASNIAQKLTPAS